MTGVHSGDATLVLPAQDLNKETVAKIYGIAQAIARALSVSGERSLNSGFLHEHVTTVLTDCTPYQVRSTFNSSPRTTS